MLEIGYYSYCKCQNGDDSFMEMFVKIKRQKLIFYMYQNFNNIKMYIWLKICKNSRK